jgi:hypothetical protein
VAKAAKKGVPNFDEQSHHVIENKRSAKRTKPNKANFSRSNLVNNFDVRSRPEPQVQLGVLSQEFLDKHSARP